MASAKIPNPCPQHTIAAMRASLNAVYDKYGDALRTTRGSLGAAIMDAYCGKLWYKVSFKDMQKYRALPETTVAAMAAYAQRFVTRTDTAAVITELGDILRRSDGWRDEIRTRRRLADPSLGNNRVSAADASRKYKGIALAQNNVDYAKRVARRITDSNTAFVITPCESDVLYVQVLCMVYEISAKTTPWWTYDLHVAKARKFVELPLNVLRATNQSLLDLVTAPSAEFQRNIENLQAQWSALPHHKSAKEKVDAECAPVPVENKKPKAEITSQAQADIALFGSVADAHPLSVPRRQVQEILKDAWTARQSLFATMRDYGQSFLTRPSIPQPALLDQACDQVNTLAKLEREWFEALAAQENGSSKARGSRG